MREFKINIQALFKAIKNNQDLKVYCLFINLHSLYNKKCIHNYKSRLQWIKTQCGISDYEWRKYSKILFKKKYIWETGSHLNIASKLHVLDDLGIEITNMPKYASKYVTLSKKDYLDIYFLKATAIKLKLEQKQYAIAENFFKKQGLTSISKIKKGIKYFTKQFLKQLADFEVNTELFLKEIKDLFNLDSIMGASNLIHVLKSKKLFKIKERFIKLRKIHKDERFDSNYNPKMKIKYGFLCEQTNNFLTSKIGHFSRSFFTNWVQTCVEKMKRKINRIEKDFLKVSLRPILGSSYNKEAMNGLFESTSNEYRYQYYIDKESLSEK